LRHSPALTFFGEVWILFVVVALCQEGIAIAMWRSAYNYCAKTLPMGEDHANYSIANWWIFRGIFWALDSLTPFVYLIEDAR